MTINKNARRPAFPKHIPTYVANTESRGAKLHQIGGVLLFLFAVSHFADLLVGDPSHVLRNPVLIFFTNRTVFLLAGVFELMIGCYCLYRRGRPGVNVAILAFVAIIVWYRCSFYYVGGFACGCAGIIGKLFHFSKHSESLIAIMALTCLFFTTVPWIIAGIYWMFRGRLLTLLLLLTLMKSATGLAETVIEVKGSYRARMYNPRTAAEYNAPLDGGFSSDADFLAVISSDQTRIIVTNSTDRNWWAEYMYDGTNSYLLNSYDFHTVRSNALSSDLDAHASVSQLPYPIRESEDKIGLTVVWMTYAMRPHLIAPNTNKVIEFPLPWLASRTDLLAFGFRWNITPNVNQVFVDHCEAVRDQSLDLDEESELLRPELAVPRGNNFRNWQLQKLHLRREWPTGFTVARFKCEKWYKTNAYVIPLASDLQVFMKGYANPSFRSVLTAKDVQVRDNTDEYPVFSQTVGQSTLIHDFRYRAVKMPRIFEAAEYTNEAGEVWKGSNDARLMAQVEHYLKNGPRYGGPKFSSRHLIVICVLLTFLLPLALLLWRAYSKNKN